ncbi:hypothetical protein PCIT_a2540 [Pseudoalteromonas citrea]|uniref:Type VI secretion system tip protein VgrG n=2 Tax=Pseudoalteromonas citrea TaxID=43655 RepID=A0AAD4AHB0_9GAMM|nr:type VI secretion system tip protein TssI/VgrG [Pseudoalteromonas citrea]KAF7769666.1 hypothetical protein PCIT_a2540 [Pseudoalteromonas citrea]
MGISAADRLKANQSHFFAQISGVPDGVFKVIGFDSNNDALCEDYAFNIKILSIDAIEASTVIGKDITLELVWSTTNRSMSGIVTHYTAHGKSHQGYHYTLRLGSYLTLLKHRRSNRVFTQMTPAAIIQTVLQKAGFPMSKAQINVSGATLDMVVQYDESDFDFLSRLMRRYGYVYGFIEANIGECKLLIAKDSASFANSCQSVNLSYVAPSGQVRSTETIFAFSQKAQFITANVSMDDYNYESPGNLQVSTRQTSSIPSCGTDSRYGENYASTESGKALAQVRQSAFDCQRETMIVDTDCRALRPGVILNVHEHPQYDGRYLVVRVEHVGDQGGGVEYGTHVKSLTYKNQATLVALSCDYKAMPFDQRRVFATFNAVIEQEVDDKGRYIVKLPFNQDGQGQQSKPTRLIQPYGGAGHGMHFALSQGTEVLVCGENGDLDRPVILGALYNEHSPSPVTSQNPTQNKLTTRSGHTLLMDDKAGQEKIELATQDGKNKLTLDASAGSQYAILHSSEGDVKVSAKEKIQLSAQDDITATSGKNINVAAKESVQMQSREGNVTIQAAKDCQISSDANIRLQANEGNVSINTDTTLDVAAKQDMRFYSADGNIVFEAGKGDISISSGKNLSIFGDGTGSIQLSQGGGSIEIDAAGNLTIDAKNLTLSATNIAIKGSAISNN